MEDAEEGQPLGHTYSKLYKKRGITQGDSLYLAWIDEDRQLNLISRLEVDRVEYDLGWRPIPRSPAARGRGTFRRTSAIVAMLAGVVAGTLMVGTGLTLPLPFSAGLALATCVAYRSVAG
jgi:hypothetical protein